MAVECKIFYSWQSDLPNATNRGFIQKALESAAKALRADAVQVEPVVDRDTVGVPGSPDIASTIFNKIDQAQIFVCDVSIVNLMKETRPTPNPNVLIELGYAIKALGSDRIIMVMNRAFGEPELLPFDLRLRRVVTYNMPVAENERAGERKRLESIFREGLQAILLGLDLQVGGAAQPLSICERAIEACCNYQQNQLIMTRQFMKWLVEELDELAPDWAEKQPFDELLVQAIHRTELVVVEFARFSEAIAEANNSPVAFAVYQSFEQLFERYDVRPGFSGSFRRTDFDFYKFIGHELFVTLFSFLIRERRWELIANLLEDDIYCSSLSRRKESPFVPFFALSEYVELLEIRNQRLQLNRVSVHADLLNQRHTESAIAERVPMQQFIDADCFLFLRAELQVDQPNQYSNIWMAWSTLYMNQIPRYLLEAYRVKYAMQLLRPLKVPDVETLQCRLAETAPRLGELFKSKTIFPRNPLAELNVQMIGSK